MSPNAVHLWVRHEERETERRAPIVPDDARRLVEQGVLVSVEDGPQRVFPIADYAAAGDEPLQQGLRPGLLLERVPEEDVPVPQ